jgi:hypothetical protein
VRGLRRQALRPAGAALVLGALLVSAGCGAEAGGADAAPDELLGPRPGKLTCTEWGAGTSAERRGTIEQLTMLASHNANPEDVGPNRVLAGDEAYETLDATCAHDGARGFLLYEIYNRAAAFDLGGLSGQGVPE